MLFPSHGQLILHTDDQNQAKPEGYISEHSFKNVYFFESDMFHFTTSIQQNKITFKISECTSTTITDDNGTRYGEDDISFEQNHLHSPEVKAISFYDYNDDGTKDVLAIYTYLDSSNNIHYFNKIIRTSTSFCHLKEDHYYSNKNQRIATNVADFKDNIKRFFSKFTDISIGRDKQYKSLTDYFDDPTTQKDNINIYLTDSLYVSNQSVWISDCNNVNIYGSNHTKLYCLDSTDNVLIVQSCINLSLNDLTLKHEKLGTEKAFSCS
ncbi:MAG: hypothetical protein AAGA66_07730, partial [Bacteroidota bacterium]